MKVAMMVDVLPVARHMFIFKSCTSHDCIHFVFYLLVFLFGGRISELLKIIH